LDAAKRKRPPVVSGLLLLAGLALVVLAYAYGDGCNFDTADVCHPFGLMTRTAWDVSATAGALFLGGVFLGFLGAAGLALRWLGALLKPRP